MFVGILLRDVACDLWIVLRELAPSRVLRNQFAHSKKLLADCHDHHTEQDKYITTRN